jgi:hypothetical protein
METFYIVTKSVKITNKSLTTNKNKSNTKTKWDCPGVRPCGLFLFMG